MKKNLFFMLLLLVFGLIFIVSRADAIEEDEPTVASGYVVHLPHKSPQKEKVTMSYDDINSTLTLTFLSQLSNVEISIYKDGVLINEESLDYLENGYIEDVCFSDYGNGEYTVSVCCEGDIIAKNILNVE
jgi:hypothetical protein